MHIYIYILVWTRAWMHGAELSTAKWNRVRLFWAFSSSVILLGALEFDWYSWVFVLCSCALRTTSWGSCCYCCCAKCVLARVPFMFLSVFGFGFCFFRLFTPGRKAEQGKQAKKEKPSDPIKPSQPSKPEWAKFSHASQASQANQTSQVSPTSQASWASQGSQASQTSPVSKASKLSKLSKPSKVGKASKPSMPNK